MLNALGNLLTSPVSRNSRRRASRSFAPEYLETRLALTASALAPVTDGALAQQAAIEAAESTGEHSYPPGEGMAEYSDTMLLEYSDSMMVGLTATMMMDDSSEAAEMMAPEVQFPDTNLSSDNTALFAAAQTQQLGEVVDERSQGSLESVGRARVESTPSLVPFALIVDEVPGGGEPDLDMGDEEGSLSENGEPAGDEQQMSADESVVSADDAVMAIDMHEEAKSAEAEPAVNVSATSDLSQAETSDDVEPTASAAVDAEEMATITVSDLDHFFSREQSTVAVHEEVLATAAVGLLGVTQGRRSRRQSKSDRMK